MRSLVTGGNGFIGGHIVDELINRGHQVPVIDNLSSPFHEKFYYNREAVYIKSDINDVEDFGGIDYVFHLAAESRIQPTLENPVLAALTNTVGTCTVLQCAKEAGVKRVVYSSTSSGYGLKNKIPLNENMPDDCLNPYSVTKISGEKLCKMYTDLFDLETVVFRYFNVYGERHPVKGQYAPVIGIFIRQKNNGEKLTIVGDGRQTRDFTHVSDVVQANILASDINNKKPVGELINLGTGTNNSVIEIAQMVSGKYSFLPARLGEAQDTLANISKAYELLGWEAKVRVEDWIKAIS